MYIERTQKPMENMECTYLECLIHELERDQYEAEQRIARAKREAIQAANQRNNLAVTLSSTVL